MVCFSECYLNYIYIFKLLCWRWWWNNVKYSYHLIVMVIMVLQVIIMTMMLIKRWWEWDEADDGNDDDEKDNYIFIVMITIITFSWENFFISLISLSILLASIGSSNALDIFLIATFSPVSLSKAEITTPYAPWPIGLIKEYLDLICNKCIK